MNADGGATDPDIGEPIEITYLFAELVEQTTRWLTLLYKPGAFRSGSFEDPHLLYRRLLEKSQTIMSKYVAFSLRCLGQRP
jgi:hypothetical protein